MTLLPLSFFPRAQKAMMYPSFCGSFEDTRGSPKVHLERDPLHNKAHFPINLTVYR